MDSLRQLIKETITGINILEGASNFIDMGPNIGLVIKHQSSEQIWLNFFDFAKRECAGVITLRKIDESIWSVTTVAARDGFGPLMYKCGMMAVYPAMVCPDKIGAPSNAAVNIWYKFYINSGELKKEIIKQDSLAYKDYGDEDKNIFLNLCYSRPASIWFNKLLENGNRFMEEKGIGVDEIRSICSNYFMNRYKER